MSIKARIFSKPNYLSAYAESNPYVTTFYKQHADLYGGSREIDLGKWLNWEDTVANMSRLIYTIAKFLVGNAENCIWEIILEDDRLYADFVRIRSHLYINGEFLTMEQTVVINTTDLIHNKDLMDLGWHLHQVLRRVVTTMGELVTKYGPRK